MLLHGLIWLGLLRRVIRQDTKLERGWNLTAPFLSSCACFNPKKQKNECTKEKANKKGAGRLKVYIYIYPHLGYWMILGCSHSFSAGREAGAGCLELRWGQVPRPEDDRWENGLGENVPTMGGKSMGKAGNRTGVFVENGINVPTFGGIEPCWSHHQNGSPVEMMEISPSWVMCNGTEKSQALSTPWWEWDWKYHSHAVTTRLTLGLKGNEVWPTFIFADIGEVLWKAANLCDLINQQVISIKMRI